VIDGEHVVQAIICLAATSDGGLKEPMPAPTPALLLKFTALDDPHNQTTVGTYIETLDGSDLVPASDKTIVRLSFWADVAQVYAVPGVRFGIWYAGRSVGHGEVLRLLDEVADSTPGTAA
jgi:hypothetical protein